MGCVAQVDLIILYVLIEFEILKPIILQQIMRNRLILIDLIHKLFNMFLIILFLLQIEDNRTSNQRCEHSQFILHFLQFLPYTLMFDTSLLIF